MKKFFLAILTASALSSAPASAEPAAMFNWTGFYLGADVGALLGDTHYTLNAAPHATPTTSSAMYGGHVGYRYQFASNWVAGIEGQLWHTVDYDSLAKFNGAANNAKIDVKHGYAAIGTLGFTIDPQILIYGAGGFSSIRNEGCVTIAGTATCGGPTASFSGDRTAFTWGGGVAILMTPNLILSFQYLRADYGTKTYSTPGVGGGVAIADVKTDMFTAGLSWKFGN